MTIKLFKQIFKHPNYIRVEYHADTNINGVERHLKGLVAINRLNKSKCKTTLHIEHFDSILGDASIWAMIYSNILKTASKDIELLNININNEIPLNDIGE